MHWARTDGRLLQTSGGPDPPVRYRQKPPEPPSPLLPELLPLPELPSLDPPELLPELLDDDDVASIAPPSPAGSPLLEPLEQLADDTMAAAVARRHSVVLFIALLPHADDPSASDLYRAC
jgi:hypothetical protein